MSTTQQAEERLHAAAIAFADSDPGEDYDQRLRELRSAALLYSQSQQPNRRPRHHVDPCESEWQTVEVDPHAEDTEHADLESVVRGLLRRVSKLESQRVWIPGDDDEPPTAEETAFFSK